MQRLRSYVVLSDIHLGLRNTPASEIIKNLYTFFGDFSDDAPIARVNAVFFAGDLWDKELPFSSEVFHDFIPFWHALLKWALRNSIAIRDLSGTPLHDRNQGETVYALAKAIAPGLDYQYVTELSVEYMEALRMNVAYVPDECRSTAAKIEEDFDKILQEKGLKSADIAIMHGMFEHQLGHIPHSHKVLNADFWLSRVSGFINIGHIHANSRRGRILAQGSFDRGGHGDEIPKGAYYLGEETPGEWVPIFIENKGAKQYRTLKVVGDAETALAFIATSLRSIPEGSHVRLSGPSNHPLIKNLELLKKKYPMYAWTKDPVAPVDKAAKREGAHPARHVGCSLNRETIVPATLEEVCSTSEISPLQRETLAGLLEGLRT